MPIRVGLEALARRGNAEAIAELAGPEAPECLDYLYQWALALHGRSGVSMNGLVPLTYGTIADWAQLTGTHPTGAEVEALLVLDGILCHPDASPDASEAS